MGQRGAKGLNRFLRMSVAWRYRYLEQPRWEWLIERVDGVVAQLYRLAHR